MVRQILVVKANLDPVKLAPSTSDDSEEEEIEEEIE